MSAILTLDAVSVSLPRNADRPHAMSEVSLSLSANEILCVVGESGSGKSMTANAVMRLLPPGVAIDSGRILFEGRDLAGLSEPEMRKVRGADIAMIFQEPMTALNPLRTIGDQIGEMFELHTDLGKAEIRDKVQALLEEVRIPDPVAAAKAYPHELSGGQRQRAMIAMALALDPRVLIADEPTTALDVTTQAQILELIRDLQKRKGTAVLFITHDFGVVAEIADRIAVLEKGVLVEEGTVDQVLGAPNHPYTQKLLAAVPSLTPPERAPLPDSAPVLTVEGLGKVYRKRSFFGTAREVRAADDITFSLRRGETLGLVGESGSGKSTVGRCCLRLIEPDAGQIRLSSAAAGDLVLSDLKPAALRAQRKRIQMVFQDPFASLNPRMRIGDSIAEGPLAHGLISRAEAGTYVAQWLAAVGLDPAFAARYPHQFSGGQRQRVAIARALAMQPDVVVCDEPVASLDVSIQAQIINLLLRLRQELGLTLLFISHDLSVVRHLCDRVAIMHRGRIVESGAAGEVYDNPRDPYTQRLLAAVPVLPVA